MPHILLRLGQHFGCPVGRLLLLGNRDVQKLAANLLQAVTIRIGAGEFDAILVQNTGCGMVPNACARTARSKPAEMKDLGDGTIFQKLHQIGRLLLARFDLDYVRSTVAERNLNHAKPVAMRVQAQCLCIDGDRIHLIIVEVRQVVPYENG